MQVAIVGTGYIAGRHAVALSAMEGVEIVGHVDVTQQAAQQAADTWGGRAYTSADGLLAAEQVDAVWLCVPPFAHGALENTFLKHDVPMYIEKPVGIDLEQPQQLLKAITAKQGSRAGIVNVGYYWRCMEIIPDLKAMLAETPPRLVRLAYHGPTAPAAWWRKQDKSGGQVVEQATHLIDIARYLLGETTVVSAAQARHDRAEYPDMDIATATAALLQFGKDVPGSFTASCVLGSFVDTAIEFLCDGRKITLSLKELHIDDADGRHTLSTGEDPLVIADRAFIQAVEQGKPELLPCSYKEAFGTQKVCYDIQSTAAAAEGGNNGK